MDIYGGNRFQAGRPASAKAPGQACIQYVLGTESRPVSWSRAKKRVIGVFGDRGRETQGTRIDEALRAVVRA